MIGSTKPLIAAHFHDDPIGVWHALYGAICPCLVQSNQFIQEVSFVITVFVYS